MVPALPGSAPDIVARVLAEGLWRLADHKVAVHNLEGANGELALSRFQRDDSGGTNWLLTQDSVIVINPSFYPRATPQVLEGLVPVAQVAVNHFLVLVRQDDPAQSLSDLFQEAQHADQAMFYGSGGVGSQHHLLVEEMARRLTLRVEHVPYLGNTLATAGILRGDIRFLMAGASALALVRAGRLRALASTAPARLATLPDVPTLAESIPDFQATAWFGLFGRSGSPPDQLAEMSELVQILMGDASLQRLLRKRGGITAAYLSGEAFSRVIETDRQRFAAVASRLGIAR